MFLNHADIATVITGLNFRTKDDRENDSSKTLEIACDVPLTSDVAAQALQHPDLRAELYVAPEKAGDPYRAKADLREVTFNVSAKRLLIVKLATSPGGTKPKTTVSGASVKAVTAYKGDSGEWNLSFRLVAPLVAAKDAVPFIDALKETVFLTFEAVNPELSDMYDTAAPTAPGAVAQVAQDGVVESVTPKKPRGPRLVKDKKKADDAADTTH